MKIHTRGKLELGSIQTVPPKKSDLYRFRSQLIIVTNYNCNNCILLFTNINNKPGNWSWSLSANNIYTLWYIVQYIPLVFQLKWSDMHRQEWKWRIDCSYNLCSVCLIVIIDYVVSYLYKIYAHISSMPALRQVFWRNVWENAKITFYLLDSFNHRKLP